MRGTKTTRLVLVYLALIAAASLLGSCGSSEQERLVGFDGGHLMIWWAYYPFIEEVTLPEKVIAGEEFEIRVKAYLPPDVPDELYYSPSEHVFNVPGFSPPQINVVATDNPSDEMRSAWDPWLGVDLAPVPPSREWLFTRRLLGDESEPRTFTLRLLAAASREDAGLIKTATMEGYGLTVPEYEEWKRYALGDGKLKWFHYDITVLPAEEGGAEG